MDLSQFEVQSKAAWLKSAEQSLKGKPIQSIDWVIDEYITLDPLYTSGENIVATDANIRSKEDNDWWIGMSFDGGLGVDTNHGLLTALENGLSSPRITDAMEFGPLLKAVRTDFIFPIFERSNLSSYLTWLETHFEDYSGQMGAFICVHGDMEISEASVKDLNNIANALPEYYHTQVDVDIDLTNLAQSLGTHLKTVQQRIDVLMAHNIKPRIRCVIHSMPHYIKMIGFIRSFKMMTAQVFASYGLSAENILIDVAIHSIAEDTKQAMIGATSEAMASVLGGVDRLEISAEGMHMEEDSEIVQRMCRNVHHIMKMESGLHLHPDPLSGSYMIEKLTQILCTRGWEDFQKRCR